MFVIYVIWLFVGAIATAVLTVLVWRSNNATHAAVRAEANSRTEEARADAAKANERAQALENANLLLREKVATLETASSIHGTELSRQKELTAKAEKDLLDLKERTQPRRISQAQHDRITAMLSHSPKGQVQILYISGDREGFDFSNDIAKTLNDAGWISEVSGATFGPTAPTGVNLIVRDVRNAPPFAAAMQQAFFAVGIPLAGTENERFTEGEVRLIVGHRP